MKAETDLHALIAKLPKVRAAIRTLDSGALHCRYCEAGADNRWNHAEYCLYQESVSAQDEALKILDELAALLSGRPSPNPPMHQEVRLREVSTGDVRLLMTDDDLQQPRYFIPQGVYQVEVLPASPIEEPNRTKDEKTTS